MASVAVVTSKAISSTMNVVDIDESSKEEEETDVCCCDVVELNFLFLTLIHEIR